MFCKVLEEGGRGRGRGIEYSVRFYEGGGGRERDGQQGWQSVNQSWEERVGQRRGNPSYLSAGCSAVILY
jgi:hypothetical protein